MIVLLILVCLLAFVGLLGLYDKNSTDWDKEFCGTMAMIACVVIGAIACHAISPQYIIKRHTKHPYCIGNSTCVMDECKTIKRCWKIVEE